MGRFLLFLVMRRAVQVVDQPRDAGGDQRRIQPCRKPARKAERARAQGAVFAAREAARAKALRSAQAGRGQL